MPTQSTQNENLKIKLIHHGGKYGVTGSCHELKINNYGILVDCGLFQERDEIVMVNLEGVVDQIRLQQSQA